MRSQPARAPHANRTDTGAVGGQRDPSREATMKLWEEGARKWPIRGQERNWPGPSVTLKAPGQLSTGRLGNWGFVGWGK